MFEERISLRHVPHVTRIGGQVELLFTVKQQAVIKPNGSPKRQARSGDRPQEGGFAGTVRANEEGWTGPGSELHVEGERTETPA